MSISLAFGIFVFLSIIVGYVMLGNSRHWKLLKRSFPETPDRIDKVRFDVRYSTIWVFENDGWCSNGTVNIRIMDDGLFIKQVFPFYFFLPTLFIPWSSIAKLRKGRAEIVFPTTVMEFKNSEIPSIMVARRLLRRVPETQRPEVS